jgi:hypothetical protein
MTLMRNTWKWTFRFLGIALLVIGVVGFVSGLAFTIDYGSEQIREGNALRGILIYLGDLFAISGVFGCIMAVSEKEWGTDK